jgi:hypothetical protein
MRLLFAAYLSLIARFFSLMRGLRIGDTGMRDRLRQYLQLMGHVRSQWSKDDNQNNVRWGFVAWHLAFWLSSLASGDEAVALL